VLADDHQLVWLGYDGASNKTRWRLGCVSPNNEGTDHPFGVTGALASAWNPPRGVFANGGPYVVSHEGALHLGRVDCAAGSVDDIVIDDGLADRPIELAVGSERSLVLSIGLEVDRKPAGTRIESIDLEDRNRPRLAWTYDVPGDVWDVVKTADVTMLSTLDGIVLLDADGHEQGRIARGGASVLTLAPDGDVVAADREGVSRFALDGEPRWVWRRDAPGIAVDVAWLPNGDVVATGSTRHDEPILTAVGLRLSQNSYVDNKPYFVDPDTGEEMPGEAWLVRLDGATGQPLCTPPPRRQAGTAAAHP
jgi:hypothetical protein